jgi:hypothetical protein
VHGLGSNPDTTWRTEKVSTQPQSEKSTAEYTTSDKEYVCWVTDFLPQDISPEERKDICVFFYNHDSFWQKNAVQTRLQNLGLDLLNRIKTHIRRTEEVSEKKALNIVYVS